VLLRKRWQLTQSWAQENWVHLLLILQDLAALHAQVGATGQGRRLVFNPLLDISTAEGQAQSRAHLEAQMAAAIAMNSPGEYKRWLLVSPLDLHRGVGYFFRGTSVGSFKKFSGLLQCRAHSTTPRALAIAMNSPMEYKRSVLVGPSKTYILSH
jgi:hypothetical protein